MLEAKIRQFFNVRERLGMPSLSRVEIDILVDLAAAAAAAEANEALGEWDDIVHRSRAHIENELDVLSSAMGLLLLEASPKAEFEYSESDVRNFGKKYDMIVRPLDKPEPLEGAADPAWRVRVVSQSEEREPPKGWLFNNKGV